MKVLCVIQARMGSTRLPNKVLMELEGKPVLGHVVDRLRRSALVDEVIVATTLARIDLAVVRFCAERDCLVYCGSENDVLDRFYQAVRILASEHVVRITADCPLMDPAVVDRVIRCHLESGAAYTSNINPASYPDGEDIEVFTRDALKSAWKDAGRLSEREHVTPYLRNHPELFPAANVVCEPDYSSLRWTLDNPEDFEFMRAVFGRLYRNNPFFTMNDVLALLAEHPDIGALNGLIARNESYRKSVQNDRIVKGEQ